MWTGATIGFRLDGNELTDWTVQDIQCEGSRSGQACTVPATVPRSTVVARDGMTFTAHLESLVVQGTFESPTTVTGVWTWFGGPCCTSTGTWSASLQGEAGSDASGDTTGDGSSSGDTVQNGAIPPDATSDQVAAITRVNWYRGHMGLPAMDMNAAVNQAAQAHADYYVAHAALYKSGQIPGGSHAEDPAVPEGFTGAGFSDRMNAAGYSGAPGFEVIAFLDDPAAAVDAWMETVYHRIPFVSPDAVDAGYGGASSAGARIDVMDFGQRGSGLNTLEVLYPWDGQTDVPRAWDGNEGPQPPAPPGGYPSGPVVTLTTAEGVALTIDQHELRGPDGTSVPHVWLPRGHNGFLSATWAMYSHEPLAAQTTWTVILEGTRGGAPWRREWSFRTGP